MITSSQQFSIENNSKSNINAFVTEYQGTVLVVDNNYGFSSAGEDYNMYQTANGNFNIPLAHNDEIQDSVFVN